jgi:hypothetical protein
MSDEATTSAPAPEPARKPRKPRKAKKVEAPFEPFKPQKRFPDSNEAFLITYVRMATRKNLWYYRDRCGVARGPAPVPTLREAWVHGLIDQNTLVWGQGLIDFLPIKNVRTLVPQIRTPEGTNGC